jgi:hypothetical protein
MSASDRATAAPGDRNVERSSPSSATGHCTLVNKSPHLEPPFSFASCPLTPPVCAFDVVADSRLRSAHQPFSIPGIQPACTERVQSCTNARKTFQECKKVQATGTSEWGVERGNAGCMSSRSQRIGSSIDQLQGSSKAFALEGQKCNGEKHALFTNSN